MPSPLRSGAPSIMRAGYLFGTTRTLQPGEFGLPPPGRRAVISGGVFSSFPSQKGQKAPAFGISLSDWKSVGRLLRSVAMITHRRWMGSWRSSDMRSLRRVACLGGGSGQAEQIRGELVHAVVIRLRARRVVRLAQQRHLQLVAV